jgi:hypothetical protein
MEPAYLELLSSNKELREKLILEETTNHSNKKIIYKLEKEIEECERYIKYLEKNLVSREDEIEQLKIELQFIHQEVKKYKDHLELKEEALLVQDNRIINLEDTIYKLRSQIYKVSINMAQARTADPLNMILADRQALSDAIAAIHVYFDRRRIPIPIDIANRFDEVIRALNAILQHIDDARNQRTRLNQMHTTALLDEANERRVWWFRSKKLLREKVALQIVNRQKNRQIAEHRRNAHRLTVRYNNDTERWRRRHFGCIQQARNWQTRYRNSDNQV